MRQWTDETLLEQMHFTNREIEQRKRLFNLNEQDSVNLKFCYEWIYANIDDITDEFYQHQTAEPEISLLIGDRDTLFRLRSSMRHYILELFQGYYDADYINQRLRVGKVHKQIGVTPKLYMSAVRLLIHTLEHSLDRMFETNKGGISRQSVHESLTKLILFDTQLVFETYISSLTSEISEAKREVENYAIGLEKTIAERTKELRDLALHDPLTGLLNQRAFYENLRRELTLAERRHHSTCLAYIDLNGFKKLNDKMGHREGDQLLTTVAEAITESLRGADLAARYGGDEFCLIIPSATIAQAEDVCKRLIEIFDKKETRGVTFSIGIAASTPEKLLELNEIVKISDSMMYKAKKLAHTKPGHHICH